VYFGGRIAIGLANQAHPLTYWYVIPLNIFYPSKFIDLVNCICTKAKVINQLHLMSLSGE